MAGNMGIEPMNRSKTYYDSSLLAGTVGHDPTTFALTARRSAYWAIFPNKSSYLSLPQNLNALTSHI